MPATVTANFANPAQVNGAQLYQAFVKTATSNPSVWIPLKYALYQSNYYGASKPSFTPGWTNDDKSAVTNFLTTLSLNNTDLSPGQQATPVVTFLSQQQQLALQYGGAASQVQVQKVAVPATSDLVKMADNAFRAATGLPATAAQSKAFAKAYQQQVMAAARASVAQPAISATPQAPYTTPQGTTPVTPEENAAAIQAQATKMGSAPKVVLQQTQQAPDAGVAAEEFARKANPAATGSQNIDNALNAMFTSLARNSQ